MNAKPPPPDDHTASGSGRALWLGWVLATAAGWLVGGPLGVILGPGRATIVSGFLGLTLGGMLAGGLQGLVLGRRGPGAGRWILTTVAAALVMGVVVFSGGLIDPDVAWVAGAVLYGPALGLGQRYLLRHHFAGAGWWVLATTVAWLMAGPVTGFVHWLVGVNPLGTLGTLVSWASLGTVYGAVTGFALVWLSSRAR